MELKLQNAIYYIMQETFVILYWLGLWSLIQLSHLSHTVWFSVGCLLLGLFGLIIVKTVSPVLIFDVIESTSIAAKEFIR